MSQMSDFFGGNNGGNNGGGFSLPPMLARFGNMFNVVQRFRQFMQNPIGAMFDSGMNIPTNISRQNPEAITNYLRASGAMTDEQYNTVSQLASFAQGFMGGNNGNGMNGGR